MQTSANAKVAGFTRMLYPDINSILPVVTFQDGFKCARPGKMLL
jgi:hypothetical protein